MTSLLAPARPYVLIVEDDEDVLDTIKTLLEVEGYETRCARNGREALEVLRGDAPPCLILLDLRMPEMNGRELLAVLGQDATLVNIPVVITTAEHDPAGVEGRRLLGKPIMVDALLDVVRAHCTPGVAPAHALDPSARKG
jgi:CheY-like chemotaxis protein